MNPGPRTQPLVVMGWSILLAAAQVMAANTAEEARDEAKKANEDAEFAVISVIKNYLAANPIIFLQSAAENTFSKADKKAYIAAVQSCKAMKEAVDAAHQARLNADKATQISIDVIISKLAIKDFRAIHAEAMQSVRRAEKAAEEAYSAGKAAFASQEAGNSSLAASIAYETGALAHKASDESDRAAEYALATLNQLTRMLDRR